MTTRPFRRSASEKAPAVASRLALFLEHPSRPQNTLRYHELQGFLFAVASAPDLVRPSEWMAEIYDGHEARFENLEEAQVILPELMALYNAVNTSVISPRAALPADCRFRRALLANFDDDAPIALWSRGFLRGHQWLEDEWDPYVPDEFDQEFAMLLMTLSFFASRKLAAAYVKELGRTDLDEAARLFRRAFPDSLAEYARLGRSIYVALTSRSGSET